MLEQLLRLLAQGGVHSYQDLMQSLSISQPLLEAMLEQLARMGYLRLASTGCGANCASQRLSAVCPVGKCSATGAGRLWVLTSKGAAQAEHLPRA